MITLSIFAYIYQASFSPAAGTCTLIQVNCHCKESPAASGFINSDKHEVVKIAALYIS